SRLLAPAVSAPARAAGLLARLSGCAVCAAAALLETISEMAASAASFLASMKSSLGLPLPGGGAWQPAGIARLTTQLPNGGAVPTLRSTRGIEGMWVGFGARWSRVVA